MLFAQPFYEFDVHYGFGASELSFNSVPGVAISIYPIEKFGFSVGVEYSSRWQTKANAQSGVNPITIDSEGDSLIFKYSIDRYSEELYGKILQVPIMLKYNDEFYYTAAGIKIGTVLSSGADISYRGLKTWGYYPQYKLDSLTEPLFQGFGEHRDSTLKTEKSSKTLIMLALEGGVKLKMSDNLTLLAGVFADYSFNKGFDKSLPPVIERVEDLNGASLVASDTWKSWQPWSVGVVLKVSFMNKPKAPEVEEADNHQPVPPTVKPEPLVIPPPPPPDTSYLPAFLLNREPDFVLYYPETRTSPSDSLHILKVSQMAEALEKQPALKLHCVGYSEQLASEAATNETAYQRALRIRYTLSTFYFIEENRIFIYAQGPKKTENRRAECFLQ